ncbi:hypothetical protein HaLaN_03048 [Haematococcus lacustris]|uniref:Secreted protein n=1 Tax=Haematococcus lacustris TaxID=44745 RepID=A0A699YDM4_HAELA|nr:hypothetical protein HaLaN_03048 [Haematococcus lacustris]
MVPGSKAALSLLCLLPQSGGGSWLGLLLLCLADVRQCGSNVGAPQCAGKGQAHRAATGQAGGWGSRKVDKSGSHKPGSRLARLEHAKTHCNQQQKSFAAAVASRENLGVRTRRSSSREPPGKGSIDGGGSGGPGVQGGSDSAPRPGQGAPPVAGAGPMGGCTPSSRPPWRWPAPGPRRPLPVECHGNQHSHDPKHPCTGCQPACSSDPRRHHCSVSQGPACCCRC